MTKEQVLWLQKEIKRDFHIFSKILFNESLERKSVEMIQKYQLNALDSLQLASGCLADPDVFVTSDKTLFSQAQKELKMPALFNILIQSPLSGTSRKI